MKAEELIKFGEKLKKTRRACKIDLKKISEQTKININFLKSFEEGKFDFLPELYVRSFLKSYLKKLGGEATDLLQEYDSLTQDKNLKVTVVTDEDLKNIKKSYPFREQIATVIKKIKPYIRQMNIIWLVIAAVVVFFIIVSLTKGNKNNQQVINAGSAGKIFIEPPATKQLDIASIAVKPEKIEPAKKELDLRLNALEKTWLLISIDDSLATEHIFESGMVHNWHAKEKFSLHVGNAAGIRLYLNGIDLGSLGKPGQVIKFDLTENGIQTGSL